jgi:hypothetical protein
MPESELARAFATVFSTSQTFSVLSVLLVWFPFLRRFVCPCFTIRFPRMLIFLRIQRPNFRTLQDAQATMQRIGTQLINASLPLLDLPTLDRKRVTRHPLRPRYVQTLLPYLLPNNVILTVRANAASSPCQALTHSEMLSQITTFLAAGHETTASAITWTLYALARAPVAQAQLRAALRACDKDDLYTTLELPLLEHTVREALRLHAPVRSTMRVYAGAAPDCFVPLQNPVRVRESTGVVSPVVSVSALRPWQRKRKKIESVVSPKFDPPPPRRYHHYSNSDRQSRTRPVGTRCSRVSARALDSTTTGRACGAWFVRPHADLPKRERQRDDRQPCMHWVPFRPCRNQGVPCVFTARPRVHHRRRHRDRKAHQVRFLAFPSISWDTDWRNHGV